MPSSRPEAVGLLLRATRFAAWKHRDQRRKGQRAEPYINHPLELAQVLWFEGGVRDEATLAAALRGVTKVAVVFPNGERQLEFEKRVVDL
ncbi:MAG: hypothetical protein ACK51K_20020, partial [Gammaproteobacteria bacterium]